MKDAKYFLVVRFTIEPQAEAQVLRWLDGGHAAEVARQPGFLWCRRLKCDNQTYVMLYGIESRAAFMAYEGNAALKAKFTRERAPFEKQMKIERFHGEVAFSA
jgi:hypothetical protein